MKKTLLILFVVCLNFSSLSQDLASSGLFVRSKKENDKNVETMNFNPALNLRSGKIPMVYHNVLSKNYTLFYVYKDKNNDSIASGQRELPFLEMHFDGRIYKAMSSFFVGDKKFFISSKHRFNGTMVNHFGSFSPSKVGSKIQANFLFLFRRPSIELYEVVLFPSVLSATDYAKIHSYLSIKYSIPLPESFDYVDIFGNVVWDAKENRAYTSRIIGLGREDKMGLKQYQSKAHADDMLIASFSPELNMYGNEFSAQEIEDNSYVLLGDNKGNLKFEKNKGHEQLLRKWKIINHKANTDLHLFFKRQDVESEISNGKEEQAYDYYVSVSTKENNALATLFPLEIKQDTLLYTHIPLNTSQKYVSIIRKQKIDFDFTYQVTCDIAAFTVNLRHGKLPFTLKIETAEGIKTITSSTMTTTFSLAADKVGKIELILEDAGGNRKRKELEAFDAFTSPIGIETNYVLSDGQITIKPILNDFSLEDLRYHWYDTTQHLLSTEETITLKNKGNYTLEVLHLNHTYCLNFNVIEALNEKEDYRIGLYPNPVQKLQEFVVYIPLEQVQDAEVLVYTNKGQLIDYKMYRKASQILYKHIIATSGMYIIVVKTGEQKQFYRLMVK